MRKKTAPIKTITVRNEPYHYDPQFPLVSIHLASNRPDQLTALVKNVRDTCINKNAYEIIVKIDTEDDKMIAEVNALIKEYGANRIKPLIGPKKLGAWSTWEFYNEQFYMTHPNAYFLWNPSDEVRFDTLGWDKIAEKYIGLFDDHIFRLKLSDNRLRNYYSLYDTLGTPDNFPFMTKKWMDICGLWGDCHSPDLFHQAVSYYLGKKDIFRDIPIFDIVLSGIEAGLLIAPAQQRRRTFMIHKLWQRALSRPIRNRYLAHAAKLKFYIASCINHATEVCFKEYSDSVTCNNNLGVVREIKCRDSFYIWDQVRLAIRHPYASKIIRMTKSLLKSPIKYLIKAPIKHTLGWYKLELLSSRQNITSVKKSTYRLIKDKQGLTLSWFDKQKKEISILPEQVEGLIQVIAKLPDQPLEHLSLSEKAKITQTISGYHVKIQLGIKNKLLLNKLASPFHDQSYA